jgi:hypothetical protein
MEFSELVQAESTHSNSFSLKKKPHFDALDKSTLIAKLL